MFRWLKSRRFWRGLLWIGLAGLGCTLLAAGTFLLVARSAQRDFRPVSEPLPPGLAERIARTPHYQRDEDSTYLTFPEWYLVFNPQEYAEFITHDRPSRFPYFKGLHQMWGSYTEVYGIAQRHYPFNGGRNLMLVVICTSSTVEFGIKGVYEKSIGRVFEWSAGGERTPEDEYYARVAREYGDFVPTRPWFEFPFGQRFKELWTTQDLTGPHFLRKWERKFWLSLEYGLKSIYAGVIRYASHSVYGVADTEVFVSAHHVSAAALARPGVRGVEQLGEGRWILALPHYQGFTDTAPLVAQDGVEFDEVAGNDEIMLTMVVPAAWEYDLGAGHLLFTQPLLSGAAQKRVVVQVPVKALGRVLREAADKHLRIEHLFDY